MKISYVLKGLAMSTTRNTACIGLEVASAPASDPANWKWRDGSPYTYQAGWQMTQPDGGGFDAGTGCAVMATGPTCVMAMPVGSAYQSCGGWNDVACDVTQSQAICYKPATSTG